MRNRGYTATIGDALSISDEVRDFLRRRISVLLQEAYLQGLRDAVDVSAPSPPQAHVEEQDG